METNNQIGPNAGQIDLIREIYLSVRSRWYAGKPPTEPARLRIDQSNSSSGYDIDRDEIVLNMGEYDLDEVCRQYDGQVKIMDTIGWIAWYRELIHEMLHEYQAKVIQGQVTEAGRTLHDSCTARPQGNGHGPDFFTAIVDVAPILNMTPEAYVKGHL